MKSRILVGAITLIAGFAFGSGSAMAQATPTSTPTPAASCEITTLPSGQDADCRTGAEEPPSQLGVSGGNFNSISIVKGGGVGCGTGTLGGVFTDNNGNPVVLGSSHAFARNGGAKSNEPIVQPGLPDLGCWQDPTDTVASLSKFSSITFSKGKTKTENSFDVAFAKIGTTDQNPGGPPVAGIDLSGSILNLGQLSSTPFPFDSLHDGLFVMKMGRGSCLTQGAIDAWDAAGVVNYTATDNAKGGTAFFNHQILVIGQPPGSLSGTPCSFATTTDSGAIVTNMDFGCPQAIGMVFAGASGGAADSGGDVVAINPFEDGPDGEVGILNKFKVSIVGKTCGPSAVEAKMGGSPQAYHMSEAMKASVESMRKIKDAHAHHLLKNSAVSAIGIGSGDSPDTAALKVYLSEDSPKIRAEVQHELGGAPVKFKKAQKFQAL